MIWLIPSTKWKNIYDAHKEEDLNFPFEKETFKDQLWETLKKLETWVKAHYSDPPWGVILYYFIGMCMFEHIPPQTFEKNS
jgi:predicted AlkP superfamily phosphohydrolase/phosphomutase